MVRATRDWINRLQLRHLEILVSIARTGSMSRTADLMALSQPALSKWLKGLEASLGVTLFERTTRRVTLTEYGGIVLRHAERVLGDMERTRAEIESTQQGLAGRVVVGALPAAAPILLPGALARLHRPRIEAQVQVHEGTLDRLLPLLQRRELDIIIGRIEGDALNLGLQCEVLYQEPICVAARAGHPLARKRRVSWKDVSAFPWIVPPWNTPMRISLDLAFSRAGLPLPQAMMESASILTNRAVAQRADCLFVASDQAVASFEREGLLCRLPLTLTDVPQDIGMLWADSPSPAMEKLMQVLRLEAEDVVSGRALAVEAPAQQR
jgi:DNA-binding transcriptional LysR family regulator